MIGSYRALAVASYALRKSTFSAPSSPTTGLARYDLEGNRPHTASASPMERIADALGGTVKVLTSETFNDLSTPNAEALPGGYRAIVEIPVSDRDAIVDIVSAMENAAPDWRVQPDDLPVERISVRSLVAMQAGVNAEKVADIAAKGPGGNLPVGIRVGGKVYIRDGHHRVIAEIGNGATAVPMRVVTVLAKANSSHWIKAQRGLFAGRTGGGGGEGRDTGARRANVRGGAMIATGAGKTKAKAKAKRATQAAPTSIDDIWTGGPKAPRKDGPLPHPTYRAHTTYNSVADNFDYAAPSAKERLEAASAKASGDADGSARRKAAIHEALRQKQMAEIARRKAAQAAEGAPKPHIFDEVFDALSARALANAGVTAPRATGRAALAQQAREILARDKAEQKAAAPRATKAPVAFKHADLKAKGFERLDVPAQWEAVDGVPSMGAMIAVGRKLNIDANQVRWFHTGNGGWTAWRDTKEAVRPYKSEALMPKPKAAEAKKPKAAPKTAAKPKAAKTPHEAEQQWARDADMGRPMSALFVLRDPSGKMTGISAIQPRVEEWLGLKPEVERSKWTIARLDPPTDKAEIGRMIRRVARRMSGAPAEVKAKPKATTPKPKRTKAASGPTVARRGGDFGPTPAEATRLNPVTPKAPKGASEFERTRYAIGGELLKAQALTNTEHASIVGKLGDTLWQTDETGSGFSFGGGTLPAAHRAKRAREIIHTHPDDTSLSTLDLLASEYYSTKLKRPVPISVFTPFGGEYRAALRVPANVFVSADELASIVTNRELRAAGVSSKARGALLPHIVNQALADAGVISYEAQHGGVTSALMKGEKIGPAIARAAKKVSDQMRDYIPASEIETLRAEAKEAGQHKWLAKAADADGAAGAADDAMADFSLPLINFNVASEEEIEAALETAARIPDAELRDRYMRVIERYADTYREL